MEGLLALPPSPITLEVPVKVLYSPLNVLAVKNLLHFGISNDSLRDKGKDTVKPETKNLHFPK